MRWLIISHLINSIFSCFLLWYLKSSFDACLNLTYKETTIYAFVCPTAADRLDCNFAFMELISAPTADSAVSKCKLSITLNAFAENYWQLMQFGIYCYNEKLSLLMTLKTNFCPKKTIYSH